MITRSERDSEILYLRTGTRGLWMSWKASFSDLPVLAINYRSKFAQNETCPEESTHDLNVGACMTVTQ